MDAPPAPDAAPRTASTTGGSGSETSIDSGDVAMRLSGRYQVVTPAGADTESAEFVEVAQFFMYGCYPCYAFEPYLVQWRATKPEFVTLIRVPVLFNARARAHARACYAAQELGVLDEIHAPLFDEIHVNGNRLDSEAALAAFFERFGVGGEAFLAAYRSSVVSAKLEQAAKLAQQYGIDATPSVVVGGRYLTSLGMAGSYEALFAVVDQLADSLRARALLPGGLSRHERALRGSERVLAPIAVVIRRPLDWPAGAAQRRPPQEKESGHRLHLRQSGP